MYFYNLFIKISKQYDSDANQLNYGIAPIDLNECKQNKIIEK